MKKLAIATLVLLSSRAASAATPVPPEVVKGNTAFAQDLYGKLAPEPGNIFFSPASISTALAMTYAGARGDTAKQMAKTLHFELEGKALNDAYAALLTRLSSSGEGVPQLAIANRIWSQKGMSVESDFLAVTKGSYGAGLELVDFVGASEPSRLSINNWVDSKTNGKIKDLLVPGVLDAQTRMVLTNAIWFKGMWATAFAKKDTTDEVFAAPSGAKKVPTMHATMHARYGVVDGVEVLELPYKSKDSDRAMSMVIVLPKAGEMGKLEKGMKLGTWTDSLYSREVIVSLPKFKITQSIGLGSTLSKMGMPLAFDEAQADFSGITHKERLHIDKVIHKAFVDVNEEGTEAAAATAVVIGTEAAVMPTVFKADRPFTFFIRDQKTGTILFLGRIADPTA
ncbi:MAG: serpin family protein [Polyangiales bacterium]